MKTLSACMPVLCISVFATVSLNHIANADDTKLDASQIEASKIEKVDLTTPLVYMVRDARQRIAELHADSTCAVPKCVYFVGRGLEIEAFGHAKTDSYKLATVTKSAAFLTLAFKPKLDLDEDTWLRAEFKMVSGLSIIPFLPSQLATFVVIDKDADGSIDESYILTEDGPLDPDFAERLKRLKPEGKLQEAMVKLLKPRGKTRSEIGPVTADYLFRMALTATLASGSLSQNQKLDVSN